MLTTTRRRRGRCRYVYVVQGPAEEKGKVRILQYTKSFHDFFYSKIFGIAPRKRKNDGEDNAELENVDEPLNSEAFMYLDEDDNLVTTGYNFIVKVTTQKVPINGKMTDVNKYDMSFSHKETEVGGINAKVFKALNEKLKFDEDFYKESTNEELLTFKTKFLTNDPTDVEEDDDDVSSDIDSIVNKKPTTKSKRSTVVVETEDDDVDSFVDHLKDLKWDEAEAIVGWIITYLVANFGIIAFCVIKLVLNKLNETKQSKAFQDALAKLSLEHQEEVKKMIAEFEAQLEAVNTDSKAFIEEQKAKIQELQSDSTKAIAEELKQVNELLK